MSFVLLALSATLALPSYRDMVEKRQVSNGAEQIAALINSAQGEAEKTKQVVTVSYDRDDDDEWCIGAVLGTTACDCGQTSLAEDDYCQIASQPFVINNGHASERNLMHSIDGDGAYAFDPVRGVFTDPDDSLSIELRSRSGDFRLNLMVNNVGRVTLCSTDEEHAIPGYEVCGDGS